MRKDLAIKKKEKESQYHIPKEYVFRVTAILEHLGVNADEYLDHKDNFYMEDILSLKLEDHPYSFFKDMGKVWSCWNDAVDFWFEKLHGGRNILEHRLYSAEEARSFTEQFFYEKIPYDGNNRNGENSHDMGEESIVITDRKGDYPARNKKVVFYTWRDYTLWLGTTIFFRVYVYTIIFSYVMYCMENGNTPSAVYLEQISKECENIETNGYEDKISSIKRPHPFFYDYRYEGKVICRRIGKDKKTYLARFKVIDPNYTTTSDTEETWQVIIFVLVVWLIGFAVIHYLFGVGWDSLIMVLWFCLPAGFYTASKRTDPF